MTDITLYHNPRCSKSRAALALLEENDVSPKLVPYLDQPPTPAELKALLSKLGMSLDDILRTGEPEFEELGLGDGTLSDSIKLDLVCKHPQLIQRPIAVRGDRAIIGRPPENVLQLLED
jgi:arsenate reductase